MPEFIETVATWNYHTNSKQYNCKEQIKRFAGNVQKIESFKTRNGCDHRPAFMPQTYRNIKFNTCYCNFLTEGFSKLIALEAAYCKGFMPFQGGYLEQPNKAMEIIALIQTLKAEHEQKISEQQKPKGKR